MDIVEWVEMAFIGLISLVIGWGKGEHSKLTKRILDIEKNYSEIDKSLAVMQSQMESNYAHIDKRLDDLDKKMDKLFDRFEKYDRDREDFFRTFDLSLKTKD